MSGPEYQMDLLEGRGKTGGIPAGEVSVPMLATELQKMRQELNTIVDLVKHLEPVMNGYENLLDQHEARLGKQGQRLEQIDTLLKAKGLE